jgi:hypothetical protein
MKQYVIDQLRWNDYEGVKGYLDAHGEKTVMDGVYWVEVPERLYTAVQSEHVQCQPYYFAVNLAFDRVDFELLIRSRQIMRCNCIAYAVPEQRDYIIGFADEMLELLKIKI